MVQSKEKIAYDNRFGFGKSCTAYWIFEPNRVGEQFIFKFPNGIKVSVARSTCWDYRFAAEGLSTASSYGFSLGRYEALVRDRDGKTLEEDLGWLDHKDVHKLLSKWRNYVAKA